MKYKLIIFDIDGTITEHISSWRYIHERLGIWDEKAFKYQDEFLAKKISYRKFCQLDAAHWKGISVRRVERIFKTFKFTKNAAMILRKLKREGYKMAAISTGLQYIPERLKREFEFDFVLSNALIHRNGKLTGGVKVNIAHGAKASVIRTLTRKFGIKPHEMISIGDSAGDLPVAKAVGYSIAFNSTSGELSRIVDHNCRTRDFKEVYERISAGR